MTQELGGVPNQYELTVRGRPVAWTKDTWAEVYSFQKGGSNLASRTDKFLAGKFVRPTNPKEGFALINCQNERDRRVLEFLIPIMYPEKPTWITVMVANTIFGAMEGRMVHWGEDYCFNGIEVGRARFEGHD